MNLAASMLASPAFPAGLWQFFMRWRRSEAPMGWGYARAPRPPCPRCSRSWDAVICDFCGFTGYGP